MKVIDIHSSGHAGNKTIKELINRLNPEKVLPIHTEKWEEFKKITPVVIEGERGMIIRV